MGFKSCNADSYVWFLPETKANGTDYYQYVLLYVDNIFAIVENPEYFIRNELGHRFFIKPSLIGPPTQYLGNKCPLVNLSNHRQAWYFSSYQYVQNLVNNVTGKLLREGRSLPQ